MGTTELHGTDKIRAAIFADIGGRDVVVAPLARMLNPHTGRKVWVFPALFLENGVVSGRLLGGETKKMGQGMRQWVVSELRQQKPAVTVVDCATDDETGNACMLLWPLRSFAHDIANGGPAIH
jgi:hypothetical protein